MATNLTPMLKRANTIDDISELRGEDIWIDAYYDGTVTKYIDGAKLHYDASTWKFWEGSPGSQIHYYWPFEGSKTAGGVTASTLDIVGYCPFTAPNYVTDTTYDAEHGAAKMTCNLSNYMTLARQKGDVDPIPEMDEYLMAVLPGQTYATQTAAGGALPLQFKHPFALVKFVINVASGTHVQINSISIAGLHTAGTCTYDGSTMTWGDYEGSATMEIAQVLKIGGTTETEPSFVVIPNDYGTKYLTVNATWDDWSDVTISDYGTDVDFNWEPGRIYTYNLTLDKYGLKVDVEKFTEQW